MHEGYIKLFRKFKKASYFMDSQYVHLWIHLLLSVNHNEKRLKIEKSDRFITLLPGQILTSRDSLSKSTGIHRSKVDRILKAFETEQQIEQQTCSKYRVISICNWGEYQSGEQQNEPQVSSRRAADEPQVSTNKNDKNVKKVKKESKGMFPLCQAWNDYLEMRIKIKKPLTDGAKGMAVKKLIVLQALGHDPVEVLNQSTFNSWQGLFEVKGKENGTGNFGGSKATGGKAPSAVSSAGSGKNGTSGLFAGDFPDKSDQW